MPDRRQDSITTAAAASVGVSPASLPTAHTSKRSHLPPPASPAPSLPLFSAWPRVASCRLMSMLETNGGGGAEGERQVAAAVRMWRLADEWGDLRATETDYVRRFHLHQPLENQCASAVAKHIKAPVHMVWSLVRRFDQPQLFKPFVSRCEMKGDVEIGSVREVDLKSGLPATRSTERLEVLDDNERILSVRFVGGDHRLKNYYSILTVHPEAVDGRPGTLVIESFIVDVPDGNTKDETCYFVEVLLKCNLRCLAEVSERLAAQDQTVLDQ